MKFTLVAVVLLGLAHQGKSLTCHQCTNNCGSPGGQKDEVCGPNIKFCYIEMSVEGTTLKPLFKQCDTGANKQIPQGYAKVPGEGAKYCKVENNKKSCFCEHDRCNNDDKDTHSGAASLTSMLSVILGLAGAK